VNSITRGIRNAFRNSIRTLSVVIILALTIGLALAMSIARSAVTTKVSSVKSSIGNTITVSPAGARGFEGGGEPLTEAELAKVSSIAHVTGVQKILNDRLTSSNTTLQSAVDAGSLGSRNSSNNGQTFTPAPDFTSRRSSESGTVSFTPPVTIIGTNNPSAISTTAGGGSFTLKSGEAYGAQSTDNVALVGATLATKNSLTVGSTFTAYSTTIKVVGIFDAGNTFSNNQVMVPLATLQTLSSQTGQVSSATIAVDSVENTDAVTSSVKTALGTAADVTNSAEEAKTTLEPLENIKKVSLFSLIGAVGAGAIIILLTMIMIVRERRREIGVLKAIGASNFVIVKQFMAEACTFTVLSAVVGLGIGVVAGQPLTKMLVSDSTSGTNQTQRAPGRGFARLGGVRTNLNDIKASVGLETLGYGLGAALIIATFGAAASALLIAKVRPAEVMRSE